MYEVTQQEPSADFKAAWAAAGQHIQRQSGGGLNWLRSDLNPPMAEHLSFRMGNQIFYIFVEAAEQSYSVGHSLFLRVAQGAGAIPCVMKMRQRISTWEPAELGWGLAHAESGHPIVPPELVSDKLIEMSAWELRDFAVQVVVGYLEKSGKRVFSKQCSLEIDPSIWFEDSSGPSFVVVREVRYPEQDALRPDNADAIKSNCAHMSRSGFFASVAVANTEELNLPLYRGHGMHVRFTGLVGL